MLEQFQLVECFNLCLSMPQSPLDLNIISSTSTTFTKPHQIVEIHLSSHMGEHTQPQQKPDKLPGCVTKTLPEYFELLDALR